MTSSTANKDTESTSGEQPTLTRDDNTALLCRLLALPGEVRNLIWEFTLAGNVIRPTLTVRPDRGVWFGMVDFESASRAPQHRFSLIRVCRQIHSEANHLVWSLSTFRFCSSFDLAIYVRQTPTPKLQLIHRIEHGERNPIWIHSQRWEHSLIYLPNLKEFEISFCTKYSSKLDIDESNELFEEFKRKMTGKKVEINMVVLSKESEMEWTDILRS